MTGCKPGPQHLRELRRWACGWGDGLPPSPSTRPGSWGPAEPQREHAGWHRAAASALRCSERRPVGCRGEASLGTTLEVAADSAHKRQRGDKETRTRGFPLVSDPLKCHREKTAMPPLSRQFVTGASFQQAPGA